MNTLTHDIMVASLRSAGLHSGDACVVHSALRGIGTLPNGPAGVVRAFQEVLTPSGVLVMPSFCYDIEPLIDLRVQPGRTGALTEIFRQMPDVVRSTHPTHSVCAWGGRAMELCAGHETTDPFGNDSPLHKLMVLKGKVLMLGVGLVTCSMVHVCEILCGLPYLHVPMRPERRAKVPFIAPDGRRLTAHIKNFPGCDAAFGLVEHGLRRRCAVRDAMLGAKPTMLFPASELLAVVKDVLSESPVALLCTNNSCACCSRRRKYIYENNTKNQTHCFSAGV